LTEEAAAGVLPGIAGHQPFRADAVGGVEDEGTLEVAEDRCCSLISVDLDVGEPRVVIDDRVHDVDPVLVPRSWLERSPVTRWPGLRKRAYSLVSMCSKSPGQGHS
jgi:hypothetical protein